MTSMTMISRRPGSTRKRGFTLIELIMYILIVGVALTGVLSSFQTATAHSSDPMLRKQAMTVAEMMLEQILAKSYQNDLSDFSNSSSTAGCTPTTTITCRANTPADLPNYNDVLDYNGWDQNAVYQQDSSQNTVLGATYNVKVGVSNGVMNGVAVRKITVTVSGGSSDPVTLVGYRASYE